MHAYEDQVIDDPEVDSIIRNACRIIDEITKYAEKVEQEARKHIEENRWAAQFGEDCPARYPKPYLSLTAKQNAIDRQSIRYHGRHGGE